MRWGRVIFALGVLGVVVLGVVLVVRALTFTLDQGPLPERVEVEFDEEIAVARLAGALRIPTVTRGEAPQLDPKAFEAMRGHLKDSFPLAFTTLSTGTINQHTLLLTWKGTNPELEPVMLMAHQDVVPIDEGTEDDWEVPPFSGQRKMGFIWGRGAIDVKSGLMGILEATEALLKEGFQPERTIYFALGHDEEIGGEMGAKAIAQYFEAKGIELLWVLDEGGVIVEGVVPGVEGPVALIGVAEKGYVSLRLRAEGTGGHSSMPPPETAVGIVAAAVHALEKNPFPARMDHAGRFFAYVGPKMPFTKRIVFANLWLFEPLVISTLSETKSMNAAIRTTTAPTMIRGGVKDNVLPTKASAVVNFRILPGETPATVKARVEQVVNDPRVTVEIAEEYGFGDAPSPVSDVHGPGFRIIRDAIRATAQRADLVVAPYLVVGATDSRYFQEVAKDTYRFLYVRLEPEDLDRMHGTNERIGIPNYLEAVRFYYKVLKDAGAPSVDSDPPTR